MKQLLFLSFFCFQLSWAQNTYKVQILADEAMLNHSLVKLLQQELSAVAIGRMELSFEVASTPLAGSINADLLITLGPFSSQQMIRQDSFPIPVIVGTVLDPELQGLTATEAGTSGKFNFNYVLNPYNVEKDLAYFRMMVPFEHLAILVDKNLIDTAPDLSQNLKAAAKDGEEIELVLVDGQEVDEIIKKLPANTDAVYLLPLGGDIGTESRRQLFEAIAQKQIPSFALLGSEWVEEGVMASRTPRQSGQILARRIALNALAILEGENASDQTVATVTVGDDFLINLEAVEKSGVYPSWEAFGQARLINVARQSSENQTSLRAVLGKALTQNLSYQLAQLETKAGAQEVKLAVSELLPNLELSTNFVAIDQARSEASFGSNQPYTWSANLALDQALLVEPLLANLKIQKLLQAGRIASQDQRGLDVILEVTEAYFNILLARNVVLLQNQNVDDTRKNYNLALNKESVGYSGVSEVYRWESQLALNKIDLNDAQANYRSAQFRLNQLLNEPQSRSMSFVETELAGDSILTLLDKKLFVFLENPGQLTSLSDFLVAEGKRNLPELRQVALSLQAQERLLLSRKRAFYVPNLGLNASTGYNIYQGGLESNTEIPPQFAEILPDPITTPTWNIAVGLSFPLYQGGSRRANEQQAMVDVMRTRQQQQDLENQLELRIRSVLQQAGASYAEIGLAKKAAEAAQRNLEIAQDGYKEGIVPIAQLIDAQNAALQTKILASNALYAFMLDFLTVERAIGFYYFLATPAEQEAFLERLALFLEP